MEKTIQPDKQTVQQCLKDKTYYVDFYQREYVWSKKTVEILLDDIFDVFEQSYLQIQDAELTPDCMEANFAWYYLNVFITNKIDNKTYIVDGQQRLSTLTLICTKLYHLTNDQDEKDLLIPCICGKDWKKNVYRIDNDKRKRAMDAIFKNSDFEPPFQNQTEQTIIERYKDISDYIDKLNMDSKKLSGFIYYFLYKLVLVELSIDNQDDTAMVFEVINDRGEALKPFEILKGKLIGALNKNDTDSFSDKWDESMQTVKGQEDNFFVTYLKSRFIYSRNSEKEKQINNEYHRYIFEQNDEANELCFRKTDSNRIESIKNFVENDVVYYSKLFAKIILNENLYLQYSNNILQLDGQYQSILAACAINDSEEDEKVKLISKEYERLYMLLRMNKVYESNDFHGISYSLNKILKELPISEYRATFDNIVKTEIATKTNVNVDSVNSVLDYSKFSQLSYSSETWFYYLLARVEDYICSQIKIKPENDVAYMSTKHSNVVGYHIEHIFSDNEENKAYFNDEEDFWNRRNNIGALLLLKGRSNISSGNEPYSEKLETYSNGPIWGKTLCSNFYHSNPDFIEFNNELKASHNVEFKSYDTFDIHSMEERCKLLYEIVKIIWDV